MIDSWSGAKLVTRRGALAGRLVLGSSGIVYRPGKSIVERNDLKCHYGSLRRQQPVQGKALCLSDHYGHVIITSSSNIRRAIFFWT